MDGLNHSVITGECSGCVAYQEKVARLEDANAALTAALRAEEEVLGHDADCADCDKLREERTDCYAHARCPESLRLGNRAYDLRKAALSDKGEGWQEVREQARLAIGHAFHLIEHNKAMCVRCREAKQRLRAALAELGGKHELET